MRTTAVTYNNQEWVMLSWGAGLGWILSEDREASFIGTECSVLDRFELGCDCMGCVGVWVMCWKRGVGMILLVPFANEMFAAFGGRGCKEMQEKHALITGLRDLLRVIRASKIDCGIKGCKLGASRKDVWRDMEQM